MRLISINEAAERLSLSRLTIRRLIRRGVLPHVRPTGRTIRVPEDAVEALARGASGAGRVSE
jgi:excisionase family DNA binding protein